MCLSALARAFETMVEAVAKEDPSVCPINFGYPWKTNIMKVRKMISRLNQVNAARDLNEKM